MVCGSFGCMCFYLTMVLVVTANSENIPFLIFMFFLLMGLGIRSFRRQMRSCGCPKPPPLCGCPKPPSLCDDNPFHLKESKKIEKWQNAQVQNETVPNSDDDVCSSRGSFTQEGKISRFDSNSARSSVVFRGASVPANYTPDPPFELDEYSITTEDLHADQDSQDSQIPTYSQESKPSGTSSWLPWWISGGFFSFNSEPEQGVASSASNLGVHDESSSYKDWMKKTKHRFTGSGSKNVASTRNTTNGKKSQLKRHKGNLQSRGAPLKNSSMSNLPTSKWPSKDMNKTRYRSQQSLGEIENNTFCTTTSLPNLSVFNCPSSKFRNKKRYRSQQSVFVNENPSFCTSYSMKKSKVSFKGGRKEEETNHDEQQVVVENNDFNELKTRYQSKSPAQVMKFVGNIVEKNICDSIPKSSAINSLEADNGQVEPEQIENIVQQEKQQVVENNTYGKCLKSKTDHRNKSPHQFTKFVGNSVEKETRDPMTTSSVINSLEANNRQMEPEPIKNIAQQEKQQVQVNNKYSKCLKSKTNHRSKSPHQFTKFGGNSIERETLDSMPSSSSINLLKTDNGQIKSEQNESIVQQEQQQVVENNRYSKCLKGKMSTRSISPQFIKSVRNSVEKETSDPMPSKSAINTIKTDDGKIEAKQDENMVHQEEQQVVGNNSYNKFPTGKTKHHHGKSSPTSRSVVDSVNKDICNPFSTIYSRKTDDGQFEKKEKDKMVQQKERHVAENPSKFQSSRSKFY